MLERRRRRRGVSTGEEEGDGLVGDVDIELGESESGHSEAPPQESGVTAGSSSLANGTGKPKTLEEQVDEWDENAPDDTWGDTDNLEEEGIAAGAGESKDAEAKKRKD